MADIDDDYDDDWMHPDRAVAYVYDRAKVEADLRAKPFLIQRQRVIQCTWVGDGPPTQWDEWDRFSTKRERDAEIARLRKEHPAWQLRARELDSFGRMREPLDWP